MVQHSLVGFLHVIIEADSDGGEAELALEAGRQPRVDRTPTLLPADRHQRAQQARGWTVDEGAACTVAVDEQFQTAWKKSRPRAVANLPS